ncbi:Trans-aconitate 2-methyltransferase [Pseudomonas synxantha]|nr:Trans-aconitate 2-methyltransferase [Pseudomonas synxantha]
MINKPKPSTAGPATTQWDPQAYLQFASLRERPVLELLDRMASLQPKRIYDLGCGTGIATQLLAKRWPEAELTGIDSSAQMLSEASYLPIKPPWFRLGRLQTCGCTQSKMWEGACPRLQCVSHCMVAGAPLSGASPLPHWV